MNRTSCPAVKHVAIDSTQNSISNVGMCINPNRIKNFATLYTMMSFQNVKMTYELFTTKILLNGEATSHLSSHVN
jgi:uncharacterized protein with HEPN domain